MNWEWQVPIPQIHFVNVSWTGRRWRETRRGLLRHVNQRLFISIAAPSISPVDIVCDRLSKILNGNFVRDGAVLTNQVCDLLKVIWKSNKMYNIHRFLSRRQTERNILVVAENLRGRMVTVLKIQLLLNTLQSSSDELKPNQKSDANRRHTYKNMTLSRGGLWSYGRERANNRNILQLKVKIKMWLFSKYLIRCPDSRDLFVNQVEFGILGGFPQLIIKWFIFLFLKSWHFTIIHITKGEQGLKKQKKAHVFRGLQWIFSKK